jgi:preprotein translocase subunit SecG
MQMFITIVHVTTCLLLVIVVLLQAGKGAEISSSFGGSSQTVFGSSGGANFFTKLTSGMAAVFMVTSLVLTLLGGQSRKSVFESISGTATAPQTKAPPVAPPAPAPATKPPKNTSEQKP